MTGARALSRRPGARQGPTRRQRRAPPPQLLLGGPGAARAAVAVLFFVNGAVFANWVPRIPDVKGGLALDHAALGTALLGAGVGALAGTLASGPLVARYGSRPVTLVSGLALCASLMLPALAGSWLGLLGGLAVMGAVDALMDVSMNAHGVVVERRYGRSILNGFHALGSVGAAGGALVGSAAAAAGLAPDAHFALAGGVLTLPVLATARWLLPATADRTRAAGAPALVPPTGSLVAARPQREDRGETGAVGATPPQLLLGPAARRHRSVRLLALLVLFAALVEGAAGDWSAVYLTEGLGASSGVAGLGYVAFATAMLLGRFAGDAVVARWGPRRTVRSGALLAAVGMSAALLVEHPLAAILAFGLVGLGVCTVFPVAFSAAGHLEGLRPGAAIATVSFVARVGFLVGPPLVGTLAEAAGLAVGLSTVVVAALAIALLVRGLPPAAGVGERHLG